MDKVCFTNYNIKELEAFKYYVGNWIGNAHDKLHDSRSSVVNCLYTVKFNV